MNAKYIATLILFAFSLLSLFSCSNDSETPSVPKTGSTADDNSTTTTQPNPAEPKPVEPVSFNKEIFPTLKKNCAIAGCHFPPNPSGGLDQSSYDKLMKGGAGGRAIIPGNGDGSLLMKRIKGQVQPQMPQGAKPLPKEEMDKIKKWIDEGAKDN